MALVACLDMIVSKKRITKALISLRGLISAFVVRKDPKTGFLASWPKFNDISNDRTNVTESHENVNDLTEYQIIDQTKLTMYMYIRMRCFPHFDRACYSI